MKTPYINKCLCGSGNTSLQCTGGSHYEQDYVMCLDCKREGAGEFSIGDAIRAWNRLTDKCSENANH